MKKIWKLSKRNLRTFLWVGCFLGFLVILVPWTIGKYFFDAHNSVHTTRYIFAGVIIFLSCVIMFIVPSLRKIMHFLGIPDRANLLDGLATILLIVISSLFLLIICSLTLLALRKKSLHKYRYMIYHYAVLTTIFFLGVWTRQHGKSDPAGKIVIANHTSPLDYLLISLFMGTHPWNIVAGINLRKNKPTFADKVIAASIGKIVEDYAISIDRTSETSKQNTARRMIEEIDNGNNIAIFSEGTRTLKKRIKENGILLQEFQDGAFRIAWTKKICIQPLVFDWPVIWRGKGDDWWGVHPCSIDGYFLPIVDPKNFQSMEDFKKACWDSMEAQLRKSKKVKWFLKNGN